MGNAENNAQVNPSREIAQVQALDERHCKLAWDLFSELRKETLESQKIRAQVIGFKITFVGTALGLIASHIKEAPNELFMVPAFAAVFFDLLIVSYSFSIKRIGYYFRTEVEAFLRQKLRVPADMLLWHEFLQTPVAKHNLSLYRNFGISALAAIPAIVGVLNPHRSVSSPLLIGLLTVGLAYDLSAQFMPKRFKPFPKVSRDSNGDTSIA